MAIPDQHGCARYSRVSQSTGFIEVSEDYVNWVSTGKRADLADIMRMENAPRPAGPEPTHFSGLGVRPVALSPPPHPLRADKDGFILHRFDDESLAAMRGLTAALKDFPESLRDVLPKVDVKGRLISIIREPT